MTLIMLLNLVRRMILLHVMQMLLGKCKRLILMRRITMWTTPAATEMRFGFEVTMYVMN
jgi:pyrroloquinoline quinone biosynthesis protein A